MKKKQIIRSVIFLCLVVLLVGCLCRLFKYENNWISERFLTYRSLKPHEIDAVYIGSSAVDRYWNCAQAYEEYGLTVYPFSSDRTPAWATKEMIKETLQYQDPKLIIIDVRSFTMDVREDSLITMSRIADALPFYSLQRWKIVADSERIMYEDEDSSFDQRFDINYYLSVGQYHNKWAEDNFSLSEFKETPSDTLGFYVRPNSLVTLSKKDAKKIENYTRSEAFEPLHPVSEQALYDVLAYLKELPCQVLFVDSPHYMTETQSGRLNSILKIIEEEGFDSIQMLGTELGEYSLDPYTDYYNLRHANYQGATKYTRYFAEYLLDRYDFWTDHRNDADTSDFDGVADHIREKIEKLQKKKKK